MLSLETLYESLQAADIPVVGMAYYQDPEMRHQHVPAGPSWWHVASDYAVRVDLLGPITREIELSLADLISTWYSGNA